MRYRETLEPSLKGLSFMVKPRMKVGIVGRTGAGKSSILQALFRLVELSAGSIEIDGVNIAQLGLHLLRKGIAYIPQQPFLLAGTIRENIDPSQTGDDDEIWKVLDEVSLGSLVRGMNDQLDTFVTE